MSRGCRDVEKIYIENWCALKRNERYAREAETLGSYKQLKMCDRACLK